MRQADEQAARAALAELAAYAAAHRNFAQAGGGNVSIKSADGAMLIKASGRTFADVAVGQGVTAVDVVAVRGRLEAMGRAREQEHRGARACEPEDWSGSAGAPRPSMEVALHALLGRVVLHTHPVSVNAFLCAEGGRAVVEETCGASIEYLYLPYAMPGPQVGLQLLRAVTPGGCPGDAPGTVFLENHGLVVHGHTATEVIDRHETVVRALEARLPHGVDEDELGLLDPDRSVDRDILQAIRESVPTRPALACLRSTSDGSDAILDSEAHVLFPDAAVFCGARTLRVDGPASAAVQRIPVLARQYSHTWGQAPRVWEIGDVVLCTGRSPVDAITVAEVCWAHRAVGGLARAVGRPRGLSANRVRELLGSQSEKYRQDLVAGNSLPE